MFIDEAEILVRAGRGGDGCISFRREKFVPKGGPDGGDGGDGGDVVVITDPNLHTLLHFRHETRFIAGSGRPGQGKQMSGRRGEDIILRVPVGTVISEGGRIHRPEESGASEDSDESETPQDLPSARSGQIEIGGPFLLDLTVAGQSSFLARGGRGGKGNVHFKSATRRAPRIATDGTEGEERSLRLTLKLLADVGLVGLPNVGKSTLLRRVSNAHPRVGDFPFTTLQPNLGIVQVGDYDSLVLADLPGLIEGASEGKGLGFRFLRHVERSRVLCFLIDSLSTDPRADLEVLEGELRTFSPALLQRPRLVCYSRGDLVGGADLPPLTDEQGPTFSAHTGEGIEELLRRLSELVRQVRATEAPAGLEPEEIEQLTAGSAPRADRAPGDAGEETKREPRSDEFFLDRLQRGDPLGPKPWPREFRLSRGAPSESTGSAR